MIYFFAFIFLLLSMLLTVAMTVKEDDEQGVAFSKIVGLLTIITIQVIVTANGIDDIIGR
jgi:hypothetical protein